MSFSRHPQADELVAFAEELADAARDLLSTRHESGRFETKEDASPVTEFDRGVESRLRDMIRARNVGFATWLGMAIGMLAKVAIAFLMIGIFIAALLIP